MPLATLIHATPAAADPQRRLKELGSWSCSSSTPTLMSTMWYSQSEFSARTREF